MLEYEKLLNQAQYSAVTCDDDAVLVVAGAGSGKTRTIVYRLAWLIEHGVDPRTILLLTFTRKAAKEMLNRANRLLDQDTLGVEGGTFHSFAFKLLRIWKPEWLEGRNFTLIDPGDAITAIQQCRTKLNLGVHDRKFPKNQTIQALLSKARNKEESVAEIIKRDAYQLTAYADDIASIGIEYQNYRREQALMDYDDLLFELELLLTQNQEAAYSIRTHFEQIMVDEYQDTNPVQARIIELLANVQSGTLSSHVMVVGDEAQSIYAFRGSTVRNILDFPKHFPNTRIIRLEENFRSTQPVLDVANNVLSHAEESFKKVLFTRNASGLPVFLYNPYNENDQADLVAEEIKYLRTKYDPQEIAVLFRSSYHSYLVEAKLNNEGILFRKFGGLKYTEAAHIKDCLAFARILLNPIDLAAFTRIASMHTGIGPKTIERMYTFIKNGDNEGLNKAIQRFPDFAKDLAFIDELREKDLEPDAILKQIIEYFQPTLEVRYADDWNTRKMGLDEIIHIAANHKTLDDFVADLVLDPAKDERDEENEKIILSTIHSAKGLEWDAVLLIDLVEYRFPSHHAYSHQEEFEEERRLMYVACTRARKELHLYVPKNIYNSYERCDNAVNESPFISEILELEGQSLKQMGTLQSSSYTQMTDQEDKCETENTEYPICHHTRFGTGKVVSQEGNRCGVQFQNYGYKVILKDYLTFD